MTLHDIGNGASLNVLEQGVGRPIVFLHGWPTNARAWRLQMDALAEHHHVLAVDLRGFGDSSPVDDPTIELLAADVRELLDRRALDDVFLVGWSMGGCVVMSYCQQFGSHRLRAIGIVDVSPRLLPADDWPIGVGTPFSPDGLGEWRERWLRDPRSVATDVYTMGFKDPEANAASVDWLIEESMRANHATAMEALLDAFDRDFRESLKDIDVPALLLYGAASTSTTPGVREFMEQQIPNATMVVFEESSHALMIEETEKFNRSVHEFAQSC